MRDSGKKFDLILGVNGSQPLRVYYRLLAPKGIFVMVGGALSQVFKSIVFGPLMSLGSRKMRFLAAHTSHKDRRLSSGWWKRARSRP